MPSIDEIFRTGLESHRISPDPRVWEGLATALGAPDGKAVLPWYYHPRKTLILALTISALSFGVGYFIASLGHKSEAGTMMAHEPTECLDIQPVEQPYTFTQDYLMGMDNAIAPPVPSGATGLTPSALEPIYATIPTPGPFVAQVALVNTTTAPTATLAFMANQLPPADAVFVASTTLVDLKNQPPFELPNEVAGLPHPLRMVSVSFNANQGVSGFVSAISRGATVLGRTEEYWAEQNNSLHLGFGYFFTRNLAVMTGIAVNDRYLQISGHGLMVDTDPGSSLEYRDRVSAYSYRLGYTSRQILLPLALRLAGKYHFLGYHLELGGFAQMGLGGERQFDVSDADWAAIGDQYANDVYYNPMHFGSFVSIGLETHITRHLGLQMDAVLRKRFVKASLPYHDLSTLEQGLQLGIFYRF